ncbi:hypothetical protein [Streptococcus oralis]|uniref:hypothetical protein n=1 Tax=Streptococcus oralis TaxID=1303 RepID=UPI0009794AAC|nr:hypothetical protein [Streptococcus oralis]AQA07442.1 putative membrane protein [Streptococcus oralis]
MWFFLALVSSLPILSDFPHGHLPTLLLQGLADGNATEVAAVDNFSLVITLVSGFFLQDILTTKIVGDCSLITIGSLVKIL